MPVPPDVKNLPIIEAEFWCEIDPGSEVFIEGPAFDLEGNLIVTAPPQGTVYRIDTQKRISRIFEQEGVIVDGAAFHRDGRLFIVCISGELLTMNPDGSDVNFLYPKYHDESLAMNDLVFDDHGNIYVTDFKGTPVDPIGGVFRLSSDFKAVIPVLIGLASPNGISITPEGNALWVGETTGNRITRIALLEDGVTIHPMESVTHVFYSTGMAGPDSNKVDKDGNLYQAIMGQGRVLVLNRMGIPVANVVIPGHEEGRCLRTSNLAFKPGTDEGYITASGEGGAWICRFKGLAEGLPLFSHKTGKE